MPTITTCSIHQDCSVAYLLEDPCPLCRALDEIDILNGKLQAAEVEHEID
jgi:hypothetical protein